MFNLDFSSCTLIIMIIITLNLGKFQCHSDYKIDFLIFLMITFELNRRRFFFSLAVLHAYKKCFKNKDTTN